MSEPELYSREYFDALLGPRVTAEIRRLADEAPAPSPEKVERLRQIFAPTVRQMRAEQENSLTPNRALTRAA